VLFAPKPPPRRGRSFHDALIDVAFRVCFVAALASGHLMVRLAGAFRALARLSRSYGPLVIVAQLPILLCWLAARALFDMWSAPCHAMGRRAQRLGQEALATADP
jgi:hypothetical protein